jgi:hypothetical protein
MNRRRERERERAKEMSKIEKRNIKLYRYIDRHG